MTGPEETNVADDIFDENGALSAAFLLARGYCCANGCRNCPYEPRHGGLDAVPRADLKRSVLPAE
ncbi:MAG TPA: DUF5522 domain-containing protein [Chloroflexota bacterium]